MKGLKAVYTGPSKVKASGKAAGPKKKASKRAVAKNPAPKKRSRDSKNIGKASNDHASNSDGWKPIRKNPTR